MRVLLVGSGAREHALAWSISQSPTCDDLVCLPGNPGMAALGSTVEGIDPTDVGAVAAMAKSMSVDLVVVGPEAPLAAGLVDALRAFGVRAFGPTRKAAALESSKAFAKSVMQNAGVPTAQAWVFTDREAAASHLDDHPGPYVVKADGLAAGKGVLVTTDRSAALDWVTRCFDGGFGDAGSTVVVEEYLDGPELSVFAICDGETALLLEPARDYKRLRDGDRGPNTGGMGSYSPVELPHGLLEMVERDIVAPTLSQMAADGVPYTGFLYVGLALTADGPKVIEYNCRLGDPETQVVLPRLRSDLLTVLSAAADGNLTDSALDWSPDAAVNVVIASAGYPDAPRTGGVIPQVPEDEDVLVFHAATAREGKHLRAAGGRVLSVVGRGPTVTDARAAAYRAVERLAWKGSTYRTDIAG